MADIISFPTRFVLMGDNQLYANAEPITNWIGCFLQDRHNAGAAFQAGSESAHPAIRSAVKLRHVQTTGARAELGFFESDFPILSIRHDATSSPGEMARDFFFELVLLDNGGGVGGANGQRATLRVHRTSPNSTQIDQSFSVMRLENMNAASLESLLKNHHLTSQLIHSKSASTLLLPVDSSSSSTSTDQHRNIGDNIESFLNNLLVSNIHFETGQVLQPTIFTVHEWVARTRTWTEVVYDVDKAIVEDAEVFSVAAFRFDNSHYDQTTILRPSLTLTETIETSFSRSFSWGLEQRIMVKAKVPFVKELEVEFKASQTWENTEGGSKTTSVQTTVQVDVIVPPFRKTVVWVVGSKGRVTLPFRYVETSTYADGTSVERTIHDGVCRSVSSVDMHWRAEYYDAAGAVVDVGFTCAGDFPSFDS